MKKRMTQAPVEKDDGTRWAVVDVSTGRPIYLVRTGVTKAEAERLSRGLVTPTRIVQINEEDA